MTESERHKRARRIVLLVGLGCITALLAHAMEQTTAPPPKVVRPKIEVAFVLDTTGSMSGLIEGAKQKVWGIANQLASGQPKPEVRIGLIGYRDRGDEYVTKRFDLTDDIDAIYSELFAFRAGGGGDTPESVNQALREAVESMSWSDSQGVYRVVFLVGDAPPHMDYQDEAKYPAIAELARSKGIILNTVQCGAMPATASIWREIASAGFGEYAVIAQDGGMVAVATPMDADMERLNRALSETALAYGTSAEKREVHDKLHGALAAPASVIAERLSYLAKSTGQLISGRSDLVDAVDEGAVELKDLPDASLPAEMRDMPVAEREVFVEKKIAERAELKRQIDGLAKERDAYVAAESARLREAGKGDGFDLQVMGTIRAQAESVGIAYE